MDGSVGKSLPHQMWKESPDTHRCAVACMQTHTHTHTSRKLETEAETETQISHICNKINLKIFIIEYIPCVPL